MTLPDNDPPETSPDNGFPGPGVLTNEGFFPCSTLGELMPEERVHRQYENDLQLRQAYLQRQQASRVTQK